MWIRPLFTIIPLNSNYVHQIGKFGIIFDTRPCEIEDLAVSFRQEASRAYVPDVEGAGSDARLAEEEALVLAKRRRASYSAGVKVA